jgi:hypothetical protein
MITLVGVWVMNKIKIEEHIKRMQKIYDEKKSQGDSYGMVVAARIIAANRDRLEGKRK